MERLCKFSVLRYVPDENRQEFINIGLVFHSPKDRYINIKITNNFSRVSAFDDEIDISLLKIILDGVKEEFSQTTTSGPAPDELDDLYFLEKRTMIYANQLQFSPIHVIRSVDIESDFEKLFKTYVYFDSIKKKRITDEEVKSIMNRVLKATDAFNKFERNIKIDIGPEEIELDYAYRTKNRVKFIKTFSFDYTNRRSIQATQIAKEWAYNFIKLKNKSNWHTMFSSNENIEYMTFIYVSNENKNIKTAVDILKEETDTIQAKGREDIIEFASKIANEAIVDVQIQTKNFI